MRAKAEAFLLAYHGLQCLLAQSQPWPPLTPLLQPPTPCAVAPAHRPEAAGQCPEWGASAGTEGKLSKPCCGAEVKHYAHPAPKGLDTHLL